MEELGKDAEFPVVDCPYMLELMNEAGWHSLTWVELRAWQEATGTELSAWEASCMIRLSTVYSWAVVIYNDKPSAAPYRAEQQKAAAASGSILRRR